MSTPRGPHAERIGRRPLSAVLALGLAFAVAGVGAPPLGAQGVPTPDRPTLDRVDSLIAEGRTEDARTSLVAWMDANQTRSRADAQRALWQRALLTVDPTQAAIDYQRLVVEYPGGPYSDRALLRLAQAAQAQGDAARVQELVAALVREYPASPARLDAAALLAGLPEPPAEPAEASGTPVQSVRDPVPPARAVEVAPEPPPQPPARTARAGGRVAPAAAVSPSPEASAPATGRWTVQIGAFASQERAQGLLDELGSDGVEARLVIVPGSRLIRVRAGRFDRQADADRERARLASQGITATVAGDADREEAAP